MFLYKIVKTALCAFFPGVENFSSESALFSFKCSFRKSSNSTSCLIVTQLAVNVPRNVCCMLQKFSIFELRLFFVYICVVDCKRAYKSFPKFTVLVDRQEFFGKCPTNALLYVTKIATFWVLYFGGDDFFLLLICPWCFSILLNFFLIGCLLDPVEICSKCALKCLLGYKIPVSHFFTLL